jgi:hypothetical protein
VREGANARKNRIKKEKKRWARIEIKDGAGAGGKEKVLAVRLTREKGKAPRFRVRKFASVGARGPTSVW